MTGFKDTKKKVRVEIIAHSGEEIELRYYNSPEIDSYLGWRLPESVARELVMWWEKFRLNRKREYPVSEKREKCQIIMYTDKYIDIREFDQLGRLKMGGWSLPRVIIEELVKWKNKSNNKS